MIFFHLYCPFDVSFSLQWKDKGWIDFFEPSIRFVELAQLSILSEFVILKNLAKSFRMYL